MNTLIEKTKKRASVVYPVVVGVLTVCLVVGGILTVLHSQRYARQEEEHQQQISQLQEALTSQEAARQEDASRLEEQESELTLRDEQIQEQESKIRDLEKQLVLKRQRDEAAKNAQQAATIQPVAPSPYTGTKVALTFDDGPHAQYTARLLDALKERGAKATFFLQGYRVNQNADLIRRMEAEGHEVGNHSQNHKNLNTLSAAGVADEMNGCADKIEAILGHRPTVMRSPYGNTNANVKAYAANEGIPIIYWGVDTLDWKNRNVNSILATAFQSGRYGIHGGSIVLMHDIHPTSVDAAIEMIDKLQASGYTLVTVSELLQEREGGIVPGRVYS